MFKSRQLYITAVLTLGICVFCSLHSQTPQLSASTLKPTLGQEPFGAMTVGLRETAKHRPPILPLHAVPPNAYELNDQVYLWIHVDAQGNVIGARPMQPHAPITRDIERVVRSLRYAPFFKAGVATDAWVQDSIPLLPIERKTHRVAFPHIPLPEVSIELSRSGCLGSCPSYTVTLQGNGRVDYWGGQYVSIAGPQNIRVPPTTVSALLAKFRTDNFLGLNGSYRVGATDLPTYVLTLRLGARSKVVEDYGGEMIGMPGVVTDLENAVDKASDSARWVTSSPSTIKAMKRAGICPVSQQGGKILEAAVRVGDLATAKALLDFGAPVPSKGYLSLAELAVGADPSRLRLPMLKLALSYPAVKSDRSGVQRALGKAVEDGDVDFARELIKAGADPAHLLDEDNEPVTYLMLAAASGSWAMLDDALAKPHDINASDSKGRTALTWVIWEAPPMEDIFPIIDRLLHLGAKRVELDKALLLDCNDPNWIPGLVARGGNVNARDQNGDTPLFKDCSPEAAQALLAAGADPSLRNKAGKTAVEAVYHPEDGKEDSRAAIIRRFMEAHAKRPE